MGKSLFIKTFGCQMNEHDTEKIAGVLANLGYTLTDSPDQADMIILNTCSVREKAEFKCYSDLGRLAELKKKNPGLKIGVGGCVAQQEGKEIIEKAPFVDIVFGTDNIASIPELLEKNAREGRGVVYTGRERKRIKEKDYVPAIRDNPVKAWVNVVDGCDKFCTFCVVPFTRGRERSRPPEDIYREVEDLVRKGYKEVTLLGQNVDSYGKDIGGGIDLAYLLEKIHSIEGLERIRFITSHPADFSDRLINAMATLPKVCEYLHLPLQAGSDRVLERMKRNYTYREYKEKIDKVREAIPNIAITTDIITGFPGETEEDFQKTLEALQEIQFDGAFAFRYSKRPFTPAAKYEDQIPYEISNERLNRVIELQNSITLSKNMEYVGREVEILIEGVSKKDKNKLTGRTRTNKVVHIPADKDLHPGDIVKVRIKSATIAALSGEVI